LPELVHDGLRGGVLYHDGQFDDVRYAISLMRTLQDLGGTAINYVEAVSLLRRNGKTIGIKTRDLENDTQFNIEARVVINATGAQAENILAMDNPLQGQLLTVSQGTHFILPHDFLSGKTALMIPKTADGRVLFAIPWHGSMIVGTTDEPVNCGSDEPRALEIEKKFLLDHITRYLGRRPNKSEIRSVWSGQRPLVPNGNIKSSRLSRGHKILVSKSGLVTMTGGKWTTYRRMGQDTIDRASEIASLDPRASATANLKLHGWLEASSENASEWEQVYGSDLPMLRVLSGEDPAFNQFLHPRLPHRLREVIWAARYEMARTVEDVLARRTGALFLDARAAIEAAPLVASTLAKELHRSASWMEDDLVSFLTIAKGYVYDD
jgi:glycerol-3-phosphate dehydrogenase